MLSARRRSDGNIVEAYFESKANGPFSCLDCGDPVILKVGRNRVNHFAHENPLACKFAEGESDDHRLCKFEIFEMLRSHPLVHDVALERPIGNSRPDVSARIRGVPVAIEVQISSLSVETIQRRTIEYARNGIYVLWLLQWTPELDSGRYAPRIWEKWIHAAYFGRVHYWMKGLEIAAYRFEPYFTSVPRTSWYSNQGKKMTGGGYSKRSKKYKIPVRDAVFDLVKDFAAKQRYWWSGNGITVPDAKIFVPRHR